MTHFGAVDETTKRLVARCVKVKWLEEQVESSAASGNETVAKKLLGVELPGAMASSLSVVEVAAHKEKPGVQTPSRREDSMREGKEGLLSAPPANGNDNESQGAEKSPFEVEDEA